MFKNSRYTIFLFLLVGVFSTSNAQLVVGTTFTPAQLVQNVLLGAGVSVSNITYTGDINAIGDFSGTTNLGLKTGIVMTTGTVLSPSGPQGPNVLSGNGVDNLFAGDVDLSTISGKVTKNAAILEFDFVPSGDTIKFNYVFGSEEYPEYVCSNSYNDVFGFLISGPNPAGGNYVGQNIALIPGTILPVTINTVNPGVAGSSSGGGTCTSLSYSSYYVDNTNGTSVDYDGFTTVLSAIAPVVCGSSYHLKIAVADAVDGVWDSGVFLEAGSLTAKVLNIDPKVSLGINDSTMYEGCGVAKISLSRSGNVGASDTIAFSFTGTAIYNTDYTVSSTDFIAGPKLVFAPGQTTATVDLNTMQDALAEGTEDLYMILTYTLCGKPYSKKVHFFIVDVSPLAVKANNDTVMACPNQLTIKAQATGGVGAGQYSYSWNSGQKTNSFTVTPTQNVQYIVSVSDTCAVTVAKDTVNITINYTPLKLTTSANVSICEGMSTTLTSIASLGLLNYTYDWQPVGAATTSVTVSPTTTTVYTITATDSCKTSVSKTITVSVPTPRALFTYDFVANTDFNFINQSSADVISWQWDFGDTTISTLSNPFHQYPDTGTYLVQLIVTNSTGCIDTIYENVIVYPDLYFYFPNAFTANHDGLNDGFGGRGVGVQSYQMQIFDRWGTLVFTSHDMSITWDGTTKNGKAPADVYVCVFNVVGAHDVKVKKVGSVTLLR